MKQAILSDLHSHDPFCLINKMRGSINSWAFLGDYDDPEILCKLVDLKDNRIVILGNHDYFFAMKAPQMSFVEVGNRRMNELIYAWRENRRAREFVKDCVDNFEGENEGFRVFRDKKAGRVLYTHASFSNTFVESLSLRLCVSNYGYDACPDNFLEMKKRNVRIMFRGHDHPTYPKGRIYSVDDLCNEKVSHEVDMRVPFFLDSHRRYIVTVGAFSESGYAVYDEDENSVEFRDENCL